MVMQSKPSSSVEDLAYRIRLANFSSKPEQTTSRRKIEYFFANLIKIRIWNLFSRFVINYKMTFIQKRKIKS